MKTLVLAPFSAEALRALEHLGEVAHEPWTATRRLYDPQEAHGVLVVHTPGRNAQAVAELVLGLMLELARHLPQAGEYVASGRWEDPSEPYTAFQGRELAGATLGIIGRGAIGLRVARLGTGVGMRVLAHDPYVSPGARGTAGVVLTGLETLLQASDFVTVHVPETPETVGLLNAALLGLIPYPPGMRLIPSNEELLDDALAQAGPSYDAVIEAEWALRQEIFWPFHRRICASIEGEAVRNAPYSSGSRFRSRR